MAGLNDILKNIKFSGEPFNDGSERSELVGNMQLTGDVVEWNRLVESLDRYDSFASLLIDPTLYSRTTITTEGGEVSYGIEHKDFHEDASTPVLSHQRSSAAEFLRKLRGFGLLADVVGSGKTFEAGIVLSELAVRGLVSSLLLIVPEEVFGDWVRTVERDFGLGRGSATDKDDPRVPTVLKHVGARLSNEDFVRCEDGYLRPRAPMIVKISDFAKWEDSSLNNKLFDVVVVDEAQHLNVDKGEDAKAMRILSRLMETKKRAGKTYCLLLSATPHSGNLADMFRLWYFIRCKGGNPADFSEGGGMNKPFRDDEVRKEYDFYTDNICHGATTIMDFVRKQKIALLRGGYSKLSRSFNDYYERNYPDEDFLSLQKAERERRVLVFLDALQKQERVERTKEELENAKRHVMRFYNEAELDSVKGYREKFGSYLVKRGLDDFDYYYEGLKEKKIDEFLLGEPAIKDGLKKIIAELYHGGVLRSIMIRQPQSRVVKPDSVKTVVNLTYFRTDMKKEAEIRLERIRGDEGAIVKATDSLEPLGGEYAITPIRGGKEVTNVVGSKLHYGACGYVEYLHSRTNSGYGGLYADFVGSYLSHFGLSDMDSYADKSSKEARYHFGRQGSLGFYKEQLRALQRDSDVRYTFEPIYDDRSDFEIKLSKLHQILDKHSDERVILFFDYKLADDEQMRTHTYDYLINSEYKDRIIPLYGSDGMKRTKERVVMDFTAAESKNAVLVILEPTMIEGLNLQCCNVIVNFEVTPNPLDMQQRIGRVFRLGQENDVTIYSIANLFTLEGYVLAYFTRIGLMNGNTGDAEILAGCNNDSMVTLRCKRPSCGNVELLSMEDVGANPEIECQRCKQSVMEEIVTGEFKCDKCGKGIARSTNAAESRYSCISGDGGILCNNGKKGNREYYCNKICALAHCKRFTTGDMAGKCAALKEYQRVGNPSSPTIKDQCTVCPYLSACRERGCAVGEYTEAIKSCSTCEYATCRPKPHAIKFEGDWSAECPACGRGRLRLMKNNSFESYIRTLYGYRFDGGASFCDSFQREIDKVTDIQDILRSDNLTTNN